MPVSYASSGVGLTNTATPAVASINLGAAGTNRVLMVFIAGNDGSSAATGVTYNGSAMTLLATTGVVTAWILANPSSGASYTLAVSPGGVARNFTWLTCDGVDQTTPLPSAAITKTGTSTGPNTNSITLPSDGMLVGYARRGYRFNGTGVDAVAPATGRATATNDSHAYRVATDNTATGAVVFTQAASVAWNTVGFALSPDGAADTTEPTLSSPTTSAVAATTATATVTTNEGNGTLYCVVTGSATAPSAAHVKLGQDHTGSAATYAGNQAVSTTGAKNFSVTGLTGETTYYAHFMHEDAATNQSTVASTSSFTTTDGTAPVLSSPTGTQTGSSTASGTVSTDEGNGTLYYYASQNSSESAATIVASGSGQAVSGTGVQNVSFTGLTPSTTYYAHYVHDDAATNRSSVVSSASFTTAASTLTVTTDPLRNASGTLLASTSIAKVAAIRLSDMTVTETWTDQSTNTDGELVLTNATWTGVPHLIVTSAADGAAAGVKVYTPA